MRTMERLGRDKLDLYQLHAVCNAGDLDACFRSGGSMETLTSAYDDGLVANLGITGHGWDAPATHLAALDLYPFATVMTSANRFMVDNTEFGRAWTDLLERAARDDVGVHLLKATARLAWGDRPIDSRPGTSRLRSRPMSIGRFRGRCSSRLRQFAARETRPCLVQSPMQPRATGTTDRPITMRC